eukprot:8423905-Alexandrium_andersonii.AAC.1
MPALVADQLGDILDNPERRTTKGSEVLRWNARGKDAGLQERVSGCSSVRVQHTSIAPSA